MGQKSFPRVDIFASFNGILVQKFIIMYMMIHYSFQIMKKFLATLYFKVSWYFALKCYQNLSDDFYTFHKSIYCY